jgi:SAM-dependent methyltransferase
VEVAPGTGPGVITPDGCAVDLYALLPPMGEPWIVHAAVPAGASVLELGAGAGRVTHPLVALGHLVVAVDESSEMLARIRGAETVRARIQDLDLGRPFDAVLLASQLINVPDHGLRRRFLEACRDHVRDGGRVLVQRHPPSWFAGDRVWTQSFTTERLDDQALAAALAESGLAVDAYLTGDGSWVRAVPASRGSALGGSPR